LSDLIHGRVFYVVKMNNALLHQYVKEQSEPAFTELVRQHIDLVYSAALRQVNSDPAAAQDVTQAVFTDLARKAPRLLRHTSLTGWLYTSTRYLSAKRVRGEQRRVAREQEAYAMNQILQSSASDAAWQELRPVLDEAMHELSPGDREVVLLRYFEGRPLAEIGARLGLTEDTARKRVARALDKLHGRLARRGITSTVAALSAALAERPVSSAPAAMAGQISQAAVAAVSVGSGTMAVLWKLVAAGGIAAIAVGLLVLPGILHENGHAASSTTTMTTAQPVAIPSTVVTSASPSASLTQSSENTGKLMLRIVTADTGQPIPSVELDYWLFLGGEAKHEKTLTASRLGVCEVPVPRATTTELLLVSERDGFADTRLQWHVDRGETIPPEYTLRLTRAVPIGGTVLDPDGNPVAGAEVTFGNQVDPSADTATESCNFGWPFHVTAATDSHGRWQIDRMSSQTLRTSYGETWHPLYVSSESSEGNPEAQKQLLAG
jgi:RNA polymerase sigma factor (sigma-70 family)